MFSVSERVISAPNTNVSHSPRLQNSKRTLRTVGRIPRDSARPRFPYCVASAVPSVIEACGGQRAERCISLVLTTDTALAGQPSASSWNPQPLCHIQGQQPSILSARLLISLTHRQPELSSFHPLAASRGPRCMENGLPCGEEPRLSLAEPLQRRVRALACWVCPTISCPSSPLGIASARALWLPGGGAQMTGGGCLQEAHGVTAFLPQWSG